MRRRDNGANNQPDRSLCFRSGTGDFASLILCSYFFTFVSSASHILALFLLLLLPLLGARTNDNRYLARLGRRDRAEKERRLVPRQGRQRERERGRGTRKDERGVAGWRLIFCSLASASGRPHFARAAHLGVERGPSIILSSVSLTSHSPAPPLSPTFLPFSLTSILSYTTHRSSRWSQFLISSGRFASYILKSDDERKVATHFS